MKKWEEVGLTSVPGGYAYEFYEELSSNQVMGVYFQKLDEELFNCAVCIMNNKQECQDWCSGDRKNHNINGKCGLEGLSKAYKLIKWFIENRLPENAELQVHGTGKRGRAYKYLTRLGFEIVKNNMEESLYVYEKQEIDISIGV